MTIVEQQFVHLADYGRPLEAPVQVVAPGIVRMQSYVLVSGEYVAPGDHQQKLVRDVWRAEGGRSPLVERHYRYVDVAGILLPAYVEQSVRQNGRLQQDVLRRTYDEYGRVRTESHAADQHVLRARRYYDASSGLFVHEERFLPGGVLQSRYTYEQDGDSWRHLKTEFAEGAEQTKGREHALELRPLEGRTLNVVWVDPLTLPRVEILD